MWILVLQPAAGEEELFFTLHRVIVQGPLGGDQREYAKGYRMIFVDGPAPEQEAARERYARKIMRSFVSRAFRKPLDDSTIDRLVAIVKEVDRQPGKEFEDGLKQAIATCLASLDTQITAESKQLAALKIHKQGLMQQLFPAPQAMRA